MAVEERNRTNKQASKQQTRHEACRHASGTYLFGFIPHPAGLRHKVGFCCLDLRLPIYRSVLFARRQSDGREALLAERNPVCIKIKDVEGEREGSKRWAIST